METEEYAEVILTSPHDTRVNRRAEVNRHILTLGVAFTGWEMIMGLIILAQRAAAS